MEPRFIRIGFERGISPRDYERVMEAVLDLTEEVVAAYPSDCDNEIFVSGKGQLPVDDTKPAHPYGPGAFCDGCGHFAARHDQNGCSGVYGPCKCKAMLWEGHRWPRPWLAAPEGLLPA